MSTDMIYGLVLRARFENEAELERALRGLERLEVRGAKVSVTIGKAGREGGIGLSQIASAALSAGFMMNMLASAYMRMNMAQMMTERGQRRYNKIVEEYGANSEEAREAAQDLEMQMNYLNMANLRVNVSTGLMLVMFAKQVGLFKSATLALVAHTVAAKAAALADWAHVAALKVKAALLAATQPWMLPVMLIGGGIAAGAVAGYGISTLATRPQPTQINIGGTTINMVTNLDEAFAERNRKDKEEYRSAAG